MTKFYENIATERTAKIRDSKRKKKDAKSELRDDEIMLIQRAGYWIYIF